jgi:hypothetical protein
VQALQQVGLLVQDLHPALRKHVDERQVVVKRDMPCGAHNVHFLTLNKNGGVAAVSRLTCLFYMDCLYGSNPCPCSLLLVAGGVSM